MDDDTLQQQASVALAIMSRPTGADTETVRLSPPLTRDEAAVLRRCFLADVATTIGMVLKEGGAAGGALISTADAASPMRALLPDALSTWMLRGEMPEEWCANAIADLLSAGHRGVCLVSADAPTLPPSLLRSAIEALRRPGERLVIGPSMEGGCCLLGLNRACSDVFRGFRWGSRDALAALMARATDLRLTVERLSPWYDVCDRLSLPWLIRELIGDGMSPVVNGEERARAPRTRAQLLALADRGDGPPTHFPSDVLTEGRLPGRG